MKKRRREEQTLNWKTIPLGSVSRVRQRGRSRNDGGWASDAAGQVGFLSKFIDLGSMMMMMSPYENWMLTANRHYPLVNSVERISRFIRPKKTTTGSSCRRMHYASDTTICFLRPTAIIPPSVVRHSATVQNNIASREIIILISLQLQKLIVESEQETARRLLTPWNCWPSDNRRRRT